MRQYVSESQNFYHLMECQKMTDHSVDAKLNVSPLTEKHSMVDQALVSQYGEDAECLKAGMILEALLKDTPESFEDYLMAVKFRMRKIEYVVPEKTGNTRLDIHLMEMANLEPVKLDEPNETWLWMWEHRKELGEMVDFSRDQLFTQMSAKTMAKTYLMFNKKIERIIERPQYMFIRVATTLNFPDLAKIKKCYDAMSTFEYIPASPTLFNAGTTISQMSSCFLIKVPDNMQSIAWTMYSITAISKANGATGISMGSIRTNSAINNSGVSKGTGQAMIIYDKITDYVDQGGQRAGASQFCQFIWHEDVMMHIGLTRKLGDVRKHIHRADTSVATYNLFWERVDQGGDWSLFCPTQVPGLDVAYGDEFRRLYLEAERTLTPRNVVKAQRILDMIAEVLIESGRPYVINIDAINEKTNMSNIGFISTLNLCQEIALPADKYRIPACNLSSTCLKSKVVNGSFDFVKLADVVRDQVYNLNAVIERNYYPLPEIEFANLESLPVGIGAQGFADVLAQMKLSFDSDEAKDLCLKISACTYFNALWASCEIAKVKGPYPRFAGSPFSKGILQFDQWNVKPLEPYHWGQEGDWDSLRADIIKYGVRNSQLTTAQPTASVSTLTDNGETWEPFYSNYFTRRTQNGTFSKLNPYLRNELIELDLWNDRVLTWIQYQEGSVQGLGKFVGRNLDLLEKRYRTTFEYSQKTILELASIRGPYIDSSQSLNIYMKNPNVKKVSECLKYSNRLGLKTLIYYLRTREARSAQKVMKINDQGSNDQGSNDQQTKTEELICSRDNSECVSCQ